ncbi:heavy metal translocating P-type ATPase [Marinibacterium profundimaris]|uniref:ATPase n=1 Tax=Marinibacterium profundimaris TaxID=1679460 RepID=A0A225NPY3_9RHOB|nr:heavy metal translocating P-type ATPase [Marinibacterium profundimaris]OWU75930.1 ATPase [Marinibacterium profundimaris]
MTSDTPLRLEVENLSCASCVRRAEAALADVPGIGGASVNLANRTATVEPGTATGAALAEALSAAGYPAREAEARLDIEGMTCAGCAGRAERALAAVPGVISAQVNLADRTARIRYFEGATTPEALGAASAEAGYPGTPHETGQGADAGQRAEEEITRTRRATLTALALTLPIFVLEMTGHVIPAFHHWIAATIGMTTSWTIQAVLATLVLIGPGRDFFRHGIPRLLKGDPDMNALVALGSGAAWIFSTVALLAPALLPEGTRAVYYEAAAVIVTLILAGRWLEARARGRTGVAIRKLIALRPETALVETENGPEERPTDSLSPGDVLVVPPGRSLAADGEVVSGDSYIDESMITGEPVPVARGAGDRVVGGTVNGSGTLRVRVTSTGADTLLSRIVAMVEEAQGARLPIQALADRVVRIFVPVVLVIATLTFVTWMVFGPVPALSHALVAAISVLIIACPCAMGLATPTSIMVGTGRAAELGVLFRRGTALEGLAGIRVIAFDKTGTLTEGRPSLTTIRPAGDWTEDAALRIAAAVERGSDHPIAKAIVEGAAQRGLDLPQTSDEQALPGYGLQAMVEGRRILLGAPRLMTREGIALPEIPGDTGADTPVWLAVDGQAAAYLAVADAIKPDASRAVAALQAEGLEVAMITGDARAPAEAIARKLGITHVEAEVLPGDKQEAVKRLRDRLGPVAFAGDGINDAPALAEADVGLAMGTGTDIAVEAADVVMVSGAVAGAVNAHHVSKATLSNIRQNLFWAFAYNSALIPVAAGVLYPLTGTLLSPMLAAGAMALSSVFVVSNALRLRRIAPALAETPARPANSAAPKTVTP